MTGLKLLEALLDGSTAAVCPCQKHHAQPWKPFARDEDPCLVHCLARMQWSRGEAMPMAIVES